MEISSQRKKAKRLGAIKQKTSLPLPTAILLRNSTPSAAIVLPRDIEIQIDQLCQRLKSGEARGLFFGAPGLGKTATVVNIQAGAARPFWWPCAYGILAGLRMAMDEGHIPRYAHACVKRHRNNAGRGVLFLRSP